jgi:hypothetical protein
LLGVVGLFVKHVRTGKCVDDSGIEQSRNPDWGHLTFLKFSDNCLKETAQFRFRDNGALLNLKADGCFAALSKGYAGHALLPYMFYIYVDAISKDRSACAERSDQFKIHRGITHTPDGALSVYAHDPINKHIWKTWCAFPGNREDVSDRGIQPYIGLKSCNSGENQRFIFGKLTAKAGNIVSYSSTDTYFLLCLKT